MRRLAAVALLVLATGCAHLPLYARNRLADLGDAVPVSGALGWGISASFEATPFVHLGLGLTPVVSARWGYGDRIFHGLWYEFEANMPWSFWLTDISPVPPRPRGTGKPWYAEPLPIVYRWQIRRDAPSGEGEYPGGWEPQLRQWGRHPPLSRESQGAFGLPESRHELAWHDLRFEQGDPTPLPKLGSPSAATLWEVSRDGPPSPQAWDLFEIDLFALIGGLRFGFRPVEFGDLLLGLVGVDYMDDDFEVPEATPLAEPLEPAVVPAQPEPAPEVAPPAGTEPAPEGSTEPVPEPEGVG